MRLVKMAISGLQSLIHKRCEMIRSRDQVIGRQDEMAISCLSMAGVRIYVSKIVYICVFWQAELK